MHSFIELQKALASEEKMDFTGAGVFGGFVSYSKKQIEWLKENGDWSPAEETVLQRLQVLVNHYQHQTYHGRRNLIKEIKQALDSLKIHDVKESTEKNIYVSFMGQKVGETKGIGKKRNELLNRLGINNLFDLLYHIPKRYDDRTQLKKFSQLTLGSEETLKGQIISAQVIRPRKGLTILKALIYDGLDYGFGTWFNQGFLEKQLKPGTEIIVTGKAKLIGGHYELTVSDYEIIGKTLKPLGIVPVYATTSGLTQRIIRSLIKDILTNIPEHIDFLPLEVIKKRELMRLDEALKQIHFPIDWSNLKKARLRLAYEELFLLQSAIANHKVNLKNKKGISFSKEGDVWGQFVENLPFTLTKAQRRVINQIRQDMNMDIPMTRLLQGDVGSGKTVVAAAAAIKAVENGYQVALMAPTEILAEQHYNSFSTFCIPLGIRVNLITGGLSVKAKTKVNEEIAGGNADIIVGTHAVIQDQVNFKRLGLVIVDEQHRFGVMQRSRLMVKGNNPDLLVTTATPIPRTLSLVLYGDLQVSLLDELPPGRQEITTRWVGEKRRANVYKFMAQEMREGRQVFVVCPLVAESENLDLKAAEEMAEQLRDMFKEFSVGLLHGKMKHQDKENIMQGFYQRDINLLVSTTVIEVGVDVPNATVMLIEGAERFGLAQLHQLRGRIGRGNHRSYCILMGQPKTEIGRKRLQIMETTNDGFVIAEEDLRLRGPGEIFGVKQHGLPEFKVADLTKDRILVQRTVRDISKLVTNRFYVSNNLINEITAFRFGEVKIS